MEHRERLLVANFHCEETRGITHVFWADILDIYPHSLILQSQIPPYPASAGQG